MAGADHTVSGMAGRYATALFELALENKAVDAVKKDLDQFDALIADSADLNRLVRSPVFTAEEQGKALYQLATLFDKVKKDPIRGKECLERLRDKRFAGTTAQKLLPAAKKEDGSQKGAKKQKP